MHFYRPYTMNGTSDLVEDQDLLQNTYHQLALLIFALGDMWKQGSPFPFREVRIYLMHNGHPRTSALTHLEVSPFPKCLILETTEDWKCPAVWRYKLSRPFLVKLLQISCGQRNVMWVLELIRDWGNVAIKDIIETTDQLWSWIWN